MLTFHLASVQSSQVDPAGETGDLQFSNSISTSELSLVESSDTAMKETGTSLQTLTSAATMERLGGSNITQPSLSTRDPLYTVTVFDFKIDLVIYLVSPFFSFKSGIFLIKNGISPA
ncbi:hypothetical protein Bca52824_094759 [Brassica carinata]|uniref:Uncharacterized protein n=1 Tax=Brassica carinata TaxID=52824 RepID=A0A8X7P3S3_BRACI|nr:hypothetical protein Bca52824_094759 [Brassica carinata]